MGLNRYAYAGNDPINGADRNGHSWLSDTWNAVSRWFGGGGGGSPVSGVLDGKGSGPRSTAAAARAANPPSMIGHNGGPPLELEEATTVEKLFGIAMKGRLATGAGVILEVMDPIPLGDGTLTSVMNMPVRFIYNVNVKDIKSGRVISGTVDLKDTYDRILANEYIKNTNDGAIFKNK